jgi:hypothetical protein
MSRRTAVLTRVRRVLLVAGLALTALPAAPALAATIGQTGVGSFTCQGFTRADTTYVVPSGGGTITSFSYQSTAANTGQQLDFLILRPAGGSNYTVVGKTGVVTLAGTGLETFTPPAPIPVQAGDILGFWHGGVLSGCLRDVGSGGGAINSDTTLPQPPDPSVDDTVSLPNGPFACCDLNESANLVTGPTSKAECKKGGWRSFGDMFKNQGECVTLFDTDT